MKERIFEIAHFADAGVLYLLIGLSLFSLLIIIERYVRIGRVARLSQVERRKLEVQLAKGSLDSIVALELSSESLEGRVMIRALEQIRTTGSRGLEQIFNTFEQIEQPKLERSLTFLATVGSNAPYIGLFGTVLGIMKSFNDLSQASSAGQQTVMAGISAALIATAAGLLVAIPNVLAYNYFQKQVQGILGGLATFKEAALGYAHTRGL
jgi:biopolymer transport protein ExbB